MHNLCYWVHCLGRTDMWSQWRKELSPIILKIEIIFHYVFISFLGASTKTLINIGLGMFLSLLVAVSILGNILVCAAIWTDKNLRKVKDLFSSLFCKKRVVNWYFNYITTTHTSTCVPNNIISLCVCAPLNHHHVWRHSTYNTINKPKSHWLKAKAQL